MTEQPEPSQEQKGTEFCTPTSEEKLTDWLKYSVTARVFIIGFLILILLTPVAMVQGLITEREQRKRQMKIES